MSLVRRLDDNTWYKHAFCQVATASDWSDARRITEPGDHGFDSTYAGPFGVEVFFPHDHQHPLASLFMGVRLTSPDDGELNEVVRWLRDINGSGQLQVPAKFISVLRKKLSSTLFSDPPVHIEVGAVNAWRDAIRFPADIIGNVNAFRAVRDAIPPHLLNERRHPLALELAYATSHEHWIGIPVSSATQSGYEIDDVLLADAIASWQ